MGLQSFSIPRGRDVEIQVSKRAAFVAGNFLLNAPHRLYRQGPGDRDDEDARESDGFVRYVTGTRPSSPVPLIGRRDIRFWPDVRVMKLPSFVADGWDAVRFFLGSGPSPCVISLRRAQDRSFPRFARQIASTVLDAPRRFSRRQGSRSFLCRDDERFLAALFRQFPTASCNGQAMR